MCIHPQLDIVTSVRNGDVHKCSVITLKKLLKTHVDIKFTVCTLMSLTNNI